VKVKDIYKIMLLLESVDASSFYAKRADLVKVTNTRSVAYIEKLLTVGEMYGVISLSPSRREYWLTDKGKVLLSRYNEFKRVLVTSIGEINIRELKSFKPTQTGVPDFISDNPWLKVLSLRGRR